MTGFQKKEKEGRMYLEQVLKSLGVEERNMYESIGRLNPVDFFFIHKDRRFCVEIKVRDLQYIGRDTYFLEEKKVAGMRSVMAQHNCTDAIYVNFFGSDMCAVFSLKKVDKYKKSLIRCRRTTAIDTGKAMKPIIECPADDAIWLKRVNNSDQWVLIS